MNKKSIFAFMLVFAVGTIVGWQVATYRANKKFMKILVPPTMIEKANELFCGMTKEEIKEMMTTAKKYASNAVDEEKIATLWQAMLALQIKAQLEQGDTNKVAAIISKRLSDFQDKYNSGDYKGHEWESLTDTLAQQIIRQPTNAPYSSPEADSKR